jgi:polyhydroxyalkanoate synthesis regulator phasin
VLSTRSRRDTVNGLLSDARKLQVDLRKRAEKAIRDIEARRTRILTTLEEQATRIVESVVKTLNVASADDLAELKKRMGDLERRLDALAKEKAA